MSEATSPLVLRVPLLGAREALRIAQSLHTRARAIRVPRAAAAASLALPELNQPGLLVLVAPPGARGAVINSAQSLAKLLAAEVAAAGPWESAVLLSVAFRALTPTELVYLAHGVREWIDIAHDRAPLPRKRHADLEWILHELPELFTAIGVHFGHNDSSEVASRGAIRDDNLYYCDQPGVYAWGVPEAGGFRILRGARIRAAAPEEPEAARLQRELREARVLISSEGSLGGLEFVEDRLFSSQAVAATVVLGRSSTGFFDWKRSDGAPIGETLRAHALK